MQFVFRINSDKCFKTLFSPRAEARGNSKAIQRQFRDNSETIYELPPDFELPPDSSGGYE